MSDESFGVQLERMVIDEVGTAIRKQIEARWDGPMVKLIDAVVASRAPQITDRIESILDSALTSPEFDEVVRGEFAHKLGKLLVSKMGGAVERQVNDLLANPATRARLTIALDGLLKSVSEGK